KNLKRLDLYCCKLFLNFELCSVFCRETVVILTLVKLLRDTEKSRGAKQPCCCIHASILAPQSHHKYKATVNTKPPYTVTGILIHKLAASLFKPRGSKRGKKVAAYSPKYYGSFIHKKYTQIANSHTE